MLCPAVFPYPVPPIEENVLDEGKLLKHWDAKKMNPEKHVCSSLIFLFVSSYL